MLTAESTSSRIILNMTEKTTGDLVLQRAFYQGRIWQTYTDQGFVTIGDTTIDDVKCECPACNCEAEEEDIDFTNMGSEFGVDIPEGTTQEETTESETTDEDDGDGAEIGDGCDCEDDTPAAIIKLVSQGDFVDSNSLSDGLYEYRCILFSAFGVETVEDLTKEKLESLSGDKWDYSEWVKYGSPEAIGYSFGNYTPEVGKWGTAVTPDDLRYTYLWGTDFKATNGDTFTDSQIQFLIDDAVKYMERELNLTIKKRTIRCDAKKRKLVKTTKFVDGDYTDEESPYDFDFRKIQRYGMLSTNQRPIIDVQRFDLIYRGKSEKRNLLDSTVIDHKKGLLKFMKRPWRNSQKWAGISDALEMYGDQTFNAHMFYEIDYTAGYETSDDIPEDLRQIVGKVAAISLLNIIGDGLMSGFSSSSLSMDGISESFSSTQSATSAYFGARIQVYKDDIKAYIQENKYKFGFVPIGVL